MTLSLIVAMAANRVIGLNNSLPWHLSSDLRRFKILTMGHTLIVGRRTFESIGGPLPGRRMTIVSRQRDYAPEGVLVAHTIAEALASATTEEVFVGGGAEIFRLTLPLADRMHMTYIAADVEGDTFFPEYDESRWRLVWEEKHQQNGGAAFEYFFRQYERSRR